jgi:hypothetical protein
MSTSIFAGNRYRFHCPVVEREEYWLACALRKHRRWRGEKIESDCATCMSASKCPAIYMIQKEHKLGKPIFVDPTETLHQIHKDVWEQIKPLMVLPIHGYGTGISNARLSQLIGREVVNIEDIRMPPRVGRREPELSAAKPRAARKKDSGDAMFNHVEDMADHITVAAEELNT